MEGVAKEKVGPNLRNLRGIGLVGRGAVCRAAVLKLRVSESPGGYVTTLLGPLPGISESVGLRLGELLF